MSEDFTDRIAVASGPSTEFARAAEIRDAAVKAHFKNNNQTAFQRATDA